MNIEISEANNHINNSNINISEVNNDIRKANNGAQQINNIAQHKIMKRETLVYYLYIVYLFLGMPTKRI